MYKVHLLVAIFDLADVVCFSCKTQEIQVLVSIFLSVKNM